MTRLIFIRHGEAEGNVARRFHGHYDSHLTENGRKQVRLLTERLKNDKIDAVYSSDLSRAYETARGIAEQRGLTVQLEPDLREIRGGAWEDVPFDELPDRFPESYDAWVNAPYRLELPGGETMREFQSRLIRAVRRITRENEGKTVCVATHGTAIRVLVCDFYARPLEHINSVAWYDNASITEVVCDGAVYRVLSEGDNAHLGEYSTLGKQTWWREDRKGER